MSLARIMSPDSQATLAARVANLEKKVRQLDQQVNSLVAHGDTMRTLVDSSPGYAWGNSAGEPYHKKNSAQGFEPWVSHSSRLVANLTSSSTVRRTFGETLLLSGSLTGLSGALVWLFELPWPVVPTTAVVSFALSASVLVLSNRSELHRLVSAQQDKRTRKQELRVEVSKVDSSGRTVGVDVLFVNGIDRGQLREFAPIVLRTECLSVNVIGGGGKIFSQPQAAALATELEGMGYATAPRGHKGRQLTQKGRALFRALAEEQGTQV